MITYQEIKDTPAYKEDTRACSVVALSIAAQVSYPFAQGVAKSVGRKEHRGMKIPQIHRALARLGKAVTLVYQRQYRYQKAFTLATVTRRIPREGTFLVYTRSHVATVVNGKLEDWSEGRKHRVTSIYRVS